MKTITILLAGLLPMPCQAQTAGAPWDWQLSEPFNLNIDVQTLDLDPDSVSATDVAALRARGVFTICYISVGTIEDWRSDVGSFPAGVVGLPYDGWPGENFLDIRNLEALLPLMQARFQACADLGFDAVEPDNMDVHVNASGFDITADDTVRYVSALADIAHGMGLRIGQKNVPDLTARLEPLLDFVITEGCLADGWCADVAAYAAHGKAILAAEYEVSETARAGLCATAQAAGISLIFKEYDLDARGARCPRA